MKVKCLIVEDEPIAREILRSYIERTGVLEVTAQFSNAPDAVPFLEQNTTELLFLDIKMPRMTGIELLKAITVKPKVIITSAFRYYATDAYELDVKDYLLKPYSYDRFLKAVNKVVADPAAREPLPTAHTHERPHIFVKGNRQLHKVYIDDILYLESQRDYLKFKMVNGEEITTRQTIAYYEQLLPANAFLRIHRSYAVALDKVSTVEANRLILDTVAIPIGRLYKQHVHEVLNASGGG